MQKGINFIKFIIVVLGVFSVSCVGGYLVKTKNEKMPNGMTHRYNYYRDRNGNIVFHGKYRKISPDKRHVETVIYNNGRIVGAEYYDVDRDLHNVMVPMAPRANQ